ncbi:JmjC domain, hydroxylase-domain-containing protein [Chytriomyces sp. MP71]|nr:JmjC domain, hydroxylase-domain-containing protein [Chytriomyces sp. MP71]
MSSGSADGVGAALESSNSRGEEMVDARESSSGSGMGTGMQDALGHVAMEYFGGSGSQGVPVFRPTSAQFSSFPELMRHVERIGRHAGIAKIVPPIEWTAALDTGFTADALARTHIHAPIRQSFMGGGLPSGAFRVFNEERRKVFSAQEWYELSQSPEFKTPQFGPDGKVLHAEPSPTALATANPTPRKKKRSGCTTTVAVTPVSAMAAHLHQSMHLSESDAGRPAIAQAADTTEGSHPAALAASSSPDPELNSCASASSAATPPYTATHYQTGNAAAEDSFGEGMDLDLGIGREADLGGDEGRDASGQSNASHLSDDERNVGASRMELAPNQLKRRKPQPKPEQPITFDFEQVASGYTLEYIQELEKFYWKNVAYVSPMYGADMLGSLFDPNKENAWNLATFDNLLNRLNFQLPGVNKPYLYFGLWKATFAWHVEDMDLFSINYIHFGAPKQWYVIPPHQRHKFERLAQGIFFDESKRCPQFLRHKTCLMSPSALAAHGIEVQKVNQFAGEFVVTFPFGYHAGYNLGFNCAESVNFALESWIEVGRQASFCKCISDSVKLDVNALFGPDGVPIPAGSDANDAYGVVKAVKKKREPRPPLDLRQCCLCPGTSVEGLLPTEFLGQYAHRRCAEFVPETYITTLEADESVKVIAGILLIPKDRWSLKCQFCKGNPKDKLPYKAVGASIQCYKGKCVRTYHVSCADAHGIFMTDDFMCYCPQHAKPFIQAQNLKRTAASRAIAAVVPSEENASPLSAVDVTATPGLIVSVDGVSSFSSSPSAVVSSTVGPLSLAS